MRCRANGGHGEGMAEGHRTLQVDGNRLTLLPEGPQRLEALIALIDGAKASLRLLYYIYRGDRSGTAVRDALVRAVDRGVKVSLLTSSASSGDSSQLLQLLQRPLVLLLQRPLVLRRSPLSAVLNRIDPAEGLITLAREGLMFRRRVASFRHSIAVFIGRGPIQALSTGQTEAILAPIPTVKAPVTA